MAAYTFETITAPQALAYNAATDTLVFTTSLESAGGIAVSFGASTISLSSVILDRTVVFGAGLYGEQGISFPDISSLVIGTAGADSVSAVAGVGGKAMHGGGGDDSLSGSVGYDSLNGGAGNDTISGGDGNDVLSGGPGRDWITTGDGGLDYIVVGQGESPTAVGQMDVVTGWSIYQTLAFANGAATAQTYMEASAADYASALTLANTAIAAGTANFVAVGIGSDVVVFVDSAGDNGVADDAIVLAGRQLSDIDYFSFHAAPTPPPTFTAITGTGGNDTLGAAGGDGPILPARISGLDGNDSLTGQSSLFGGGADSLSGGAGDDTLNGLGNADLIITGAGADLVVVGAHQSPVAGFSPNQVPEYDRITDWSAGDHIAFANGAGNILNYLEATAASADAALTIANTAVGAGTIDFVAVQVGADVYLFADTGNDNEGSPGRPVDDAVVLLGRTLADIDYGNLVTAPGAPAAPPVIAGTSGADSLTGGGSGEILAGLDGADSLSGAGGGDTLNGGNGADTLDGGLGADSLTGAAGADVFVLSPGNGVIGGPIDTVFDWSPVDSFISSLPAGTALNFRQEVAIDLAGAATTANSRIAAGVADYVVFDLGGGQGVVVFADTANDNGVFDSVVYLPGRSAADISYTSFLSSAAPGVAVPNPGFQGTVTGNMDTARLSDLIGQDIVTNTPTQLLVGSTPGNRLALGGTGFTYDANDQLTGGTVTSFAYTDTVGGAQVQASLTGGFTSATRLLGWVATNSTLTAFSTILGGDDTLTGGAGGDLIRGFAGGDRLDGGGGADTLAGGDGADTLIGGEGADVFQYLYLSASPAALAANGHTEVLDHVLDWSSADFLQFAGSFYQPTPAATALNYRELSAANYDSALDQALGAYTNEHIDYTAAQVGADVVVFAPRVGQAVVLSGRTLVDISQANLGPTPAAPAPPPPPDPPPSGGGGGGFGGGGFGGGSTPLSLVPTSGSDSLSASGASTEVHAGAGNDTIAGGDAPDYIRGDEGDDVIMGGTAFDDINGNMGDDTASGGLGDDWVVGGKDQDSLSGDAGQDVVWGNLGADTLSGGADGDQVRGGQGDDIISGGDGDDFVSGDRGNDTIAGGAGADLFHGSQDAGIDQVIDFNAAEGDRVFLDPGTTYTVSQVGATTVIDMGGGHQMLLMGVQLSTLPAGWIFGA